MCIDSPDAILTLANGFRLSSDECQHQFSGHRWNCSEVWKQNILGHMIPLGSREAAVVYALSSAAGVYSLALACSKGNISICGCHRHQNIYHDQVKFENSIKF
jgi:wingless-type MMTV integration site family, member 7